MPSALRWPTPVALSNATTPGAMPVLSNTSSRPWHTTHSEISSGNATTPAHVRIRERHRQEMHDPFHARDHSPGLAEIDLRAARRPLQIGETARLSSMLLPPTLDPTLHRRIPTFRHEPLVHAGRGMALLDGHAQIGGRPALHDGRVPSSTSDLPGRAVVDDLGE